MTQRTLNPSVLITHRYFWPENLSLYPAMLKDIAEGHVADGHDVTIFTAAPTTDAGRQQRHRWADEHGIRLIEKPLPVDRGKSAAGRIGAIFTYARHLWSALRSAPYDVAIVGTTPPIVPAIVARLALGRTNRRYVYYVQDITPEMLAANGSRISRWIASGLEYLDRWSVAGAAATVTLSEEMRSTLLRRSGARGDVSIIPNYAIEDASYGHAGDPPSKPRLVFAGNQGPVQNLHHLLQTVAIANREAEFDVELIGDGKEHARLRRLSDELKLRNVAFTGSVPREEARTRIEDADIGIVAAAPGLYQVAYPSKVNSYLVGGLPVLVFAEADSSIADWLREHRFGTTASPSDPESAARSLVSVVRQVRRGDYNRTTITRHAADLLSPERHQRAYRRVLSSLLPTPTRPMNYSNDRVRFDAQQFNFAQLVLDAINGHLAKQGHSPIERLSDIHTVPGIEGQLEEYRQLLFSLFRSPAFQEVYRAFGAKLIDEHFTPDAIIQKTPTVRIHLDGGKSVSFHSDAWYGHGHKVCSFWLPLTPVFGSNSLQMARSIDASREFLDGIEPAQLDLDEINELASALCDPTDGDFGDLIVFNADMVHGTLENGTGQSRVSFDFRIAESVHEIGTKPANNFYSREELDAPVAHEADTPTSTAPRRKAYMYSGLCRGVSAKSQLIFLNEYARTQGIDIVGSESEIVTFSYCPVLQKYTKTPPPAIDTVLLFSVDLLPDDPAIRQRIYEGAIASGIALVFGAEDFAITGREGVDRAEALLGSTAERHLPQVA